MPPPTMAMRRDEDGVIMSRCCSADRLHELHVETAGARPWKALKSFLSTWWHEQLSDAGHFRGVI